MTKAEFKALLAKHNLTTNTFLDIRDEWNRLKPIYKYELLREGSNTQEAQTTLKSTFRSNQGDKVIEFLSRRFPLDNDCSWLDGNCYYMAKILEMRFPAGNIFYDVIDGHFLFNLSNKFYDFRGLIEVAESDMKHIIKWAEFDSYDKSQKLQIERECIM